MGLNKICLGDYAEIYTEKCNVASLSAEQVSGINRDKEFFEPSHQVGNDTSNYKVVPPNYFACNLMHVGRDVVLPIALNCTNKNKIVSPAYTIFSFEERKMLRKYLLMYLKSSEKDRYFWLHTDASVRDGLSWGDFCDINIELPDIQTQQKYVDVYNAMVENQKAYETGLDDLKLTCDAYIEELRRKMPCEKIGKYIEQIDRRNGEGKYSESDVFGISTQKEFIKTVADLTDVNLANYKLVPPEHFAYVSDTSRRGDKISLACNLTEKTLLVSSISCVFQVSKPLCLLPEYLSMFLSRAEFDRYARFCSWGSARESFTFEEMCDVEISIPDIKTQRAIADIYKVWVERREINEKLKQQIKDICPVLIRGSLQEAARA